MLLMNKKKAVLFLVFSCLILICITLAIILFIPAGSSGKDGEVCISKECLIMAEQLKRPQYVSSTVCIPRSCVSLADFPEYERICIIRKCLSEGIEKEGKSNKTCLKKSCILNAYRTAAYTGGKDDLCVTPTCVLKASAILKMMDSSADPCDDFYEFSCGNFIQENIKSKEVTKTSSERLAENKVSLKIRDILEAPSSIKESNSLSKAKIVYSSCQNKSHNKEKSVAELKALLTTPGIGIWPILDPKWSDCHVDLELRMAMLNAHGVDSFFRLETEYKGINNTLVGSVYMAEPLVNGICDGVFEEEDGNLTDFAMDVIKDQADILNRVLSLFDAHDNTTEEDVEDLFRFDYKFCNATRLSRKPYLRSYKTSNQTLQDLISVAPQINWSRWHNAIFKELGVNQRLDKTPVYVYNVDKSLAGLVELLESSPSRTVANYLSWKFVLYHLGFLSSPFSQIIFDYRPLFSKNLRLFMAFESSTPRWKQCVRYVQNMMPMALIPSYLSRTVSPELQHEINNITSVIQKIYNETFTDKLNKTKSTKKITSLKFRLLYPDKDRSFYEDYYSDVGKLSRTSFLTNGIALMKFHLKKVFEGVLKKSNSSNIEYLLALNDPFAASSWSDMRGNRIMLSFAALANTGIDAYQARYLNYGSFGTAFASGIARGFDLTSISGKPGIHTSPKNWTTWSKNDVLFAEKRHDCFERHYLARGGLHNENMPFVVDSIVADNQGVHVSFKAYLNHTKSHGKEQRLPGLSFTNEQIFFIKYAQTWCNSVESEDNAHRMRINGALRNAEVFTKAFSCPEGNMNPVSKCLNLGQ